MEQHNRLAEQQKVLSMKARKKQEDIAQQARTRKEFNECLMRNQKAERDSSGIPVPCQTEACRCAFAAGDEQVEKDVKTFTKYAFKQPSPSWWPF